MFDKELAKPVSLQQVEVILKRLPLDHHKRAAIEEKARRLRAGYNGEKNLNYFLTLLPEKDYRIFHNIRLPVSSSFFQIDFILISPKFVLILDSKNYSGILRFEKHQLTRIANNIKEIFPNPLSQATRHKILLRNFFDKFQIPLLPIEELVVITQESSRIIISNQYSEALKKVYKSYDILSKVHEFEKIYKSEIIDHKTATKMKKLLLSNHTPEKIDFIKTFEIRESDILPGVSCPKCDHLLMQYKRNKWICPKCEFISIDAHIQTLNEYFLLKSSITNAELRAFLQIPSSRAATSVITSLQLPYKGTNRWRVYYPNSTNHVSKNNTNNK